jgi:hypothetical protein
MAIIAISLWIKVTVRGEAVFGGKFNRARSADWETFRSTGLRLRVLLSK